MLSEGKAQELLGGFRRLKLCARDAEDLLMISALLQDALVPIDHFHWQQQQARCVAFVFRLLKEKVPENGDPAFQAERVKTALVFEHVQAVVTQGIDKHKHRGLVFNLLAVEAKENRVDILFGGGGIFRLSVSDLACFMEDLGEPWPASGLPTHE